MTTPASEFIKQLRAGRWASGSAAAGQRPAPCPPSLTGGESLDRAKVDWLTCTFQPELGEILDLNIMEWLSPLLGGCGAETVNGMHCYLNGLRFWAVEDGTSIHLGRLDWGGDARGGRARLELSGAGSSRVRNFVALRRELEALTDCKITRVDLAVDALHGEFGVEDVVDWYQSGDFNMGGRNPRHSLIGDWLAPKHGRTFEVGRRENGKMMRAYEKGRQLGDQSSLWTRFEVEIRNNDRDIPFEVLTDSDSYFVGAYKCLERILDAAGTRIKTHQKEGEISLETLVAHAQNGYGRVLNVMRLTGVSCDDIVDQISRPGIPSRLERASLGGFLNGPPTGLLN
jgi:phage replication initiation protein